MGYLNSYYGASLIMSIADEATQRLHQAEQVSNTYRLSLNLYGMLKVSSV